jgi:hypothetical protein
VGTVKRLWIALFVVALAMPGVQLSAQERNVAHGQLLRLDRGAKRIVIRTETGSQMQFAYTSETIVNGADDTVAGLGAQKGTAVSVKYEKQETRLLALEVDVHPATP